MDFTIPEHTQSMIRVIRDFMQQEVYPLERDFLNASFREMLPALKAKREKARAMGLWAPHIPEELGGQGLSLLEFAHVSEELGRSPIGHYIFNCQAPDVGNMEILMLHGTDEHGAAFTIVMAVTNPGAESRYLRASMIIVPTDTPGFKWVRNIAVMGEPGSDYASHAEVLFDNCRVPQSNQLGPEGMGFVIAQERLGPGRIHHCMRWIGICERAFGLMCEWAATRHVAPDRTLSSRQIIQAWIAESRAEINAARLMVLQTAWKIDQEGSSAARNEISLIKFYVAGVLQRVLDRAIQVHGGMGMTDDLPLAYWYRHERAARIYDGPDEVHKIVVARRILREYEG
jgi:acyl-CoA dehydrogenase